MSYPGRGRGVGVVGGSRIVRPGQVQGGVGVSGGRGRGGVEASSSSPSSSNTIAGGNNPGGAVANYGHGWPPAGVPVGAIVRLRALEFLSSKLAEFHEESKAADGTVSGVSLSGLWNDGEVPQYVKDWVLSHHGSLEGFFRTMPKLFHVEGTGNSAMVWLHADEAFVLLTVLKTVAEAVGGIGFDGVTAALPPRVRTLITELYRAPDFKTSFQHFGMTYKGYLVRCRSTGQFKLAV